MRVSKTLNLNIPDDDLNVLRVTGLVNNKRKGQQIYYSFNKDWFRSCRGDFLSMYQCCKDFLDKYQVVERKSTRS